MTDCISILVIDDEEELLGMVENLLKLDGYDVSTANNGETGLAIMEEHMPDLVLLDIMMPGTDGIRVLQSIREHSGVPVIMLTARSEMFMMCDVLDLGADDYVVKPFSMRELRARIRSKLRRHSLKCSDRT